MVEITQFGWGAIGGIIAAISYYETFRIRELKKKVRELKKGRKKDG